jgi:hypothetical protein
MMELSPQTLELLQTAIYAASIVFLGMLMLNAVSDLVIRLFGGDD